MTKNNERNQLLLLGLVFGGSLYFLSKYLIKASNKQFVQVKGNRFQRHDKDYFVFGANYWQAMNLGSSSSGRETLIKDLDQLKQEGVNNIRIMVGSEGPENEPFRVPETLISQPYQYNAKLLDGLDFALDAMGSRGFTVVMCLNNYWQWSGGFAQYVTWITGTPIPYPQGWDPIKKEFTNGSLVDFMNHADKFYKDAGVYKEAMKIFKHHIEKIITRKNKYSGYYYKDDPCIFSWELANEPQFPTSDWIVEISNYIKSLDQNHLLTVGLESRETLDEFLVAHSHFNIDYCTVHIWAQNRGIYNMTDDSEVNLSNSINWAIGWLEKVNRWSNLINKPLILEEFGLARDNFQAKEKADLYSPEHTTTRRDKYFGALIQRAAEISKEGGCYCGFGFWSYSGISRPQSGWLGGDPPHEPPGWYSVYDKDKSTFKVLRNCFEMFYK